MAGLVDRPFRLEKLPTAPVDSTDLFPKPPYADSTGKVLPDLLTAFSFRGLSGSNNRLVEFSPSGTLLNTISAQVSRPYDVYVDPAGNIWDAEPSTSDEVKEFSSSGVLKLTLGTTTAGSANGQYNEPSGVAVDNSGNLNLLFLSE